MNAVTWLLAGAVLGWLASLGIRRRHPAHLFNIVVGMIGAFGSGYLLSPMFQVSPIDPKAFNLETLIIALAGAAVLLAIVNFIRRENNVNLEGINGEWAQVRSKIHSRWGKLTDEDMTSIDGNHNRLNGALQTRYGYTAQKAEDQIQRYLKSVLAGSRRSWRQKHPSANPGSSEPRSG